MADRVLVVRRRLPATQQDVFRAWTDAETMSRWFFAGEGWTARAEIDLTVGGAYRVDMISPDGAVVTQNGYYREIEPHDRISFTWSNDLVTDSLVVLDFRPHGQEAEVVITHYLPDQDDLVAAHKQGWDACLANLGRLAAGV